MYTVEAAETPRELEEVVYLKIILDSLAHTLSLFEMSEMGLDRQFIKQLSFSVDSRLKADPRITKDVRTKVLHAFNILIEQSAPHQPGPGRLDQGGLCTESLSHSTGSPS